VLRRNGIRVVNDPTTPDTIVISVVEQAAHIGTRKVGSAVSYAVSLHQPATLHKPGSPVVNPITWQISGVIVQADGMTGAVARAVEEDLEGFANLRLAAKQGAGGPATSSSAR
jgi:hypothetical protein